MNIWKLELIAHFDVPFCAECGIPYILDREISNVEKFHSNVNKCNLRKFLNVYYTSTRDPLLLKKQKILPMKIS